MLRLGWWLTIGAVVWALAACGGPVPLEALDAAAAQARIAKETCAGLRAGDAGAADDAVFAALGSAADLEATTRAVMRECPGLLDPASALAGAAIPPEAKIDLAISDCAFGDSRADRGGAAGTVTNTMAVTVDVFVGVDFLAGGVVEDQGLDSARALRRGETARWEVSYLGRATGDVAGSCRARVESVFAAD